MVTITLSVSNSDGRCNTDYKYYLKNRVMGINKERVRTLKNFSRRQHKKQLMLRLFHKIVFWVYIGGNASYFTCYLGGLC